jgi:hypothetical protein
MGDGRVLVEAEDDRAPRVPTTGAWVDSADGVHARHRDGYRLGAIGGQGYAWLRPSHRWHRRRQPLPQV